MGRDPLPPFISYPSAGRCYNIRTIQEFLGHKDVNTTMIYTHVLNKGSMLSGAQSMKSEPSYTVCIRRTFDRRSLLEGFDIKAISRIPLNLEHALIEA